jgi:transporter family-2 protein
VSKELAVLATVGAGALVAAQPPVNNVLSERVGTLGAATVNFVVATVVLLVMTFVIAGGLKGDEGVESPAWYYWVLGGVAGIVIVVATLVTVRELGAGGVAAALIAGQLTASVVLDRLAVFGLEERGITWQKLIGIALLTIGTVLIVRE